jgi:hypothetical protein
MAQQGIFTTFEDDDKIPGQISVLSSGMWSGGVGTLTSFYTSSTQSGSTGVHYYDVYNGAVGTNATASVQFSLTYGHLEGSGSLTGDSDYAASKAVYRQLRNLLLTQNTEQFSFGSSNATSSKSIYAVSVNRGRLKEKMDPGNWELRLSGSGGKILHLIDNSGATSDPNIKQTVREFDVISGSIATGVAVTGSSTVYFGKFYPETGLMILDTNLLCTGNAGLGIDVTGYGTGSNNNDDNSAALFNAVEGGVYFAARREEQIKSTHYFCRVKHGMYNHSQNPTYFTSSDGSLTVPSFKTDPKSYITTVGLYNGSNELLAVAKLSRPILKSTSREALIKIRLDF